MTEDSDERNERHADIAKSDRSDRIDLALKELTAVNPELASTLARLTAAVASEALRNKRLAKALLEACNPVTLVDSGGVRSGHGVRRPRRSAGPWDPFVVYSEHGEEVLRDRLAMLDLEQLRDIIAEHGMDTDRLAMKWRDPSRVVNRIVERVIDRAAKGDAFRSTPRQ